MQNLYLDCFSGIAGDMFLGVLLELGLPLKALNLPLAAWGLRVQKKSVLRAGLSGTQVTIRVAKAGHTHRRFKDIQKIISRASLSDGVKERSLAVFRELAQTEARLHGVSVNQVHFYEIGAWDAIADIVGACIGLEHLGLQKIFCSAVNTGRGMVKSQHGQLPVPAPATLELLRGFEIYAEGPPAELTTPTGAALLKVLAQPISAWPKGRVVKIGYGAGTQFWPEFPNLLRGISYQPPEKDLPGKSEDVMVLTTHLDDVSPQVIGYALERLLAQGALDAVWKTIGMKKNRPGCQLEIIARPQDGYRLAELIFQELPTLGIRMTTQARLILPRTFLSVKVHGYLIRIKQALGPQAIPHLIPEYEDAKKCALATGLALNQVLEEARQQARRTYDRRK